jgi:hypothetical protein
VDWHGLATGCLPIDFRRKLTSSAHGLSGVNPTLVDVYIALLLSTVVFCGGGFSGGSRVCTVN